MKKIFTPLFLAAGMLSLQAQNENTVHGDLIVMTSGDAAVSALCEQLSIFDGASTGLKYERTLSESMHIYLLHFDDSHVNEHKLLTAVRLQEGVKIAQFNHLVNERNTVPNDPSFSVMWDMENLGTSSGGSGSVVDADIDAPEAWDVTTGGLTTQGDTIVVAVVDGGFKLNHVDLNFWKNYAEIPNNGIDDDLNGYVDDYDGWNSGTATDNLPIQTHGTHVAGTVGAIGNNGIGVTGVNWNVKVMPISYGSGGGGTFEANVVAAYAYARDQRRLYNTSGGTKGAFVVSTNSSFGVDLAFPASYPLWCAMYDSLGAVGILSAGATANQNYNIDTQGDIPTSCPSDWLITVTNTKNNDQKTTSAGYGATTIDLGSPGTNITSTYYSGSTDTYSAISGTSMATPHVAGTVALMLSVACPQFIIDYKTNPAAMALVLKDSLLNATDPLSGLSGITVTGGRLNLYRAVHAIENYCVTTGVGSNEGHSNSLISVFPNPATSSCSIGYSSTGGGVFILRDVLGREVLRTTAAGTSGTVEHQRIDLEGLKKGMYFISLESVTGTMTTKLIIR